MYSSVVSATTKRSDLEVFIQVRLKSLWRSIDLRTGIKFGNKMELGAISSLKMCCGAFIVYCSASANEVFKIRGRNGHGGQLQPLKPP